MFQLSLYNTYKRYRTLRTHRISVLPIVILMPHSACNCRCIMCDIWKDNKNLKQLTEADVSGLMASLKELQTQQVLISGGEALLNPNFFKLCKILRNGGMRLTLLSTGLSLKQNATQISEYIDDLIVSLDGDEVLHNQIRNIPDAYLKLKDGLTALRKINAVFKISCRTVIHNLNFRSWHKIIQAARELNLDSISFLPADVSSHAFNREILWTDARKAEILISEQDVPELHEITEEVILWAEKNPGFIAEDEKKLRNISKYYSAFYGHNPFPFKKCNAPWVSVVVEADGNVRPCFFHGVQGNIHNNKLIDILNNEKNLQFRRELDMMKNPTCVRCVCSLNLSPGKKLN